MTSRQRWLVTGASGMVAGALVDSLLERGEVVATVTRKPDPRNVARNFLWDVTSGYPGEILEWEPSVIVHAASLTDVDKCETDPAEAVRVNVGGTESVACLAADAGARLVQLSTDSVFDGKRGRYRDTDNPSPLNVYARTKLESEARALDVADAAVLRFNVVGPSRLAWWILNSVRDGKEIPVFSNVRFNPLHVDQVAGVIDAIVTGEIRGIVHAGSDEAVSKADFAERLVNAAALDSSLLKRVELDDSTMIARRPLDTSLVSSDSISEIVPTLKLSSAIETLVTQFRQ
jgi:dTDP-4-dehydrorhamnose reductase